MAGLKELRTRIESIKSTQKITSAMKMVAAARLRKAQLLTENSAAYNNGIASVLARAAADIRRRRAEGENVELPTLMQRQEGAFHKYLLIVFTSDRGLCGSYNANVAKVAVQRIKELRQNDCEVEIMCIGRKGRDIIRRFYPDAVVSTIDGIARKGADYTEASMLAELICGRFAKGEFDACEVVCSLFRSVMNREIKATPYLPVTFTEPQATGEELVCGAAYDYEPSASGIIDGLLSQYLKSQFFSYIINSQASEQGARMTSMDNATRNAKDMIARLTLKYNRLRQTSITTELIEIIAGAEAL